MGEGEGGTVLRGFLGGGSWMGRRFRSRRARSLEVVKEVGISLFSSRE